MRAYKWRKFVSEWVLELAWLPPGSIWSWKYQQLAGTQNGQTVLLDLVRELPAVLQAVSASCADSSRVTDSWENVTQLILSPDNRTSSWLEEEGGNQGRMGHQSTLLGAVGAEGSRLGWTHETQQEHFKHLPCFIAVLLIHIGMETEWKWCLRSVRDTGIY